MHETTLHREEVDLLIFEASLVDTNNQHGNIYPVAAEASPLLPSSSLVIRP